MTTRVAINGFGRIGRNAFKVAFERQDLEIVAINDLTDTKTLAYLLKHDSNYGTYDHEVGYDETGLTVDGKHVLVTAEKEPTALPWKDNNIDVVIESTGFFVDPDKAKAHITAGAKKVVISAPSKGDNADSAQTIVLGVNDDKLEGAGEIVSNASCTTNAIAPVAGVIENAFGIEKLMMTTIHSYTASQKLQDAPGGKALRDGRSAAENIVPTTTGASIAAAKALPALKGVFGGFEVRVPTPVVSLADFVIITKRPVTVEEVNEAFKKAAAEPYYQGILTVTEEELVSSDFIGNSHSAIVDLNLTNVIADTMLKVVAWYDNEWGYSNRLVEVVADIGKFLNKGSDSPAQPAVQPETKSIVVTDDGNSNQPLPTPSAEATLPAPTPPEPIIEPQIGTNPEEHSNSAETTPDHNVADAPSA
ncbi:MAG TPA: type I glyceraldehyde-3-phosphate dehydrogenase [Candidatus Saccharimonadales bacterium]|nr:type I glyceraldehyde-3-phosphate dehydrogenase [Candidatus Saccharimonadales bacterium]